MAWENNFFYLLFLNAVTGSVAFFISKLLLKVVLKQGNARQIYNLLRGVVVFYTVPFAYIYTRIKCMNEVGGHMFGYRGNQHTASIFYKIFLVWLILTSAIAIYYGVRAFKFFSLRKYNLPYYDDRLKELFCSFYPHSRFKKVQMYTNMMISTPCIMGVFRPALVLPDIPYNREELVVMMAHEATHVLHRDTLWKTIGCVVSVLCWWNPFLHLFLSSLEDWSETYCDYSVCKFLLDGDRYRYVEVLMSAAVKSKSYASGKTASIATFSDDKTLYRRVKRLSKLNMGKRITFLGIILSAVFILGSSMTAIAAGEITSGASETLYMDTMEVASTSEDLNVINLDEVDNVTVFSMTAEELAAEGYTFVQMESESDIATYGTQKIFNWDIEAASMAATSGFLKTKNSEIEVHCYVTFPSGQEGSARVGVIRPDGTFTFAMCENNDAITVNYTCESFGSYCVAVQNIRSFTINANGFYVR